MARRSFSDEKREDVTVKEWWEDSTDEEDVEPSIPDLDEEFADDEEEVAEGIENEYWDCQLLIRTKKGVTSKLPLVGNVAPDFEAVAVFDQSSLRHCHERKLPVLFLKAMAQAKATRANVPQKRSQKLTITNKKRLE
ncbi:2-Cys peroxiredoxin BAS1-like, chloroplastic-like protein [Corchorus capsularis]|uniref:2-Cys peroxiredoxin BAS1-like, chloroplastic-like protein n=1 Tax=Corchorus capsularis TaxID=210143 RepID=A0A1R3KH22_COCAP|nr:2-Cys peroxiredoxin BAS1-like, chloroplastic-like protein [Corchorus capsularis]